MNPSTLKPQPPVPQSSKPQRNQSSLKLITFGIGNLTLALPIDAVFKVVNCEPVYSSGLNHMGVTHIGDREITIVDLQHKLFKTASANESTATGYLAIGQNHQGEFFGIPTPEPPLLMEVPLEAVRLLPPAYRRADTLGIADRVAVIPQASTPQTIFLLDVDCLLPAAMETVELMH